MTRVALAWLALTSCGGIAVIDADSGMGGGGASATSSSVATGSGGAVASTSAVASSGPGGGIPNDSCATAIDATDGGSFSGTTCGADATFTSTGMCGPIGSPDVFFFINKQPGQIYSYAYTLTPGFYLMVTLQDSGCTAPSGCPPLPSFAGDGFRYLAIQRSDGSCGNFTFTLQQQS